MYQSGEGEGQLEIDPEMYDPEIQRSIQEAHLRALQIEREAEHARKMSQIQEAHALAGRSDYGAHRANLFGRMNAA